MLLVFLGMIAMLIGLVVMVLGGTWIGLILQLGGGGLMVYNYATMMRGRGCNPDQGTLNGLNGQGKQQSETVDVNMPEPGEQTPDVWEKIEK